MEMAPHVIARIFKGNFGWLVCAQAASILPLLFYLPVWVAVVWILALIWRVQIHRGVAQFPGMVLKASIAMGSVLAIVAEYSGKLGAEPMVAFLVCSFVLKIVEMKTRKDALIVLFIAYIAIATQFLFAQDLLAGLYGVASLLVLLSAWGAVFFQKKITVFQQLQSGMKIMLYAFPLMFILFVVMPRIGPLWSVPIPSNQGKVGFSDSLALGDIGSLVTSSQTAFRVQFEGSKPQLKDLYWRALVLDQFDGVTWSRGKGEGYGGRLSASIGDISGGEPDEALDQYWFYSIIMEPHYYRWLFSIGVPVSAESALLRISRSQELLLSAAKPVSQKTEYRIKAEKHFPFVSLTAQDKLKYLSIPPDSNQKARALGEEWASQGLSLDEKMANVLSIYAEAFAYTLRVSTVKKDAIDHFLFESKRGFCEHFASSFVFLMRAAGVPARIVVGYQGGEYVGVGDYFLVKQSDAHAWAEVWSEQTGWRRVDPTAAVAPTRVDMGVSEALDSFDRTMLGTAWQNQFFSTLRHQWDALGYNWNRWVLNYDTDQQKGLLQILLGSSEPARVGVFLVSLFLLAVGPLILRHWWRSRIQFRFSENGIVRPLLERLKRRGLAREVGEPVEVFLLRAAQALRVGKGKVELELIARQYELIAYSQHEINLAEFKRKVKVWCRRY